MTDAKIKAGAARAECPAFEDPASYNLLRFPKPRSRW